MSDSGSSVVEIVSQIKNLLDLLVTKTQENTSTDTSAVIGGLKQRVKTLGDFKVPTKAPPLHVPKPTFTPIETEQPVTYGFTSSEPLDSYPHREKLVFNMTGLYSAAQIKEMDPDRRQMIGKTSVEAVVVDQPNSAFTIVLIAGLSLYLCLKPAVVSAHTTAAGVISKDHHLPGNIFDAMQHSAVSTVRNKYAQFRKLFTDSPRHIQVNDGQQTAKEVVSPIPSFPKATKTKLWGNNPTANRPVEHFKDANQDIKPNAATGDRLPTATGRTTRSTAQTETTAPSHVSTAVPAGGSVVSEEGEGDGEGYECAGAGQDNTTNTSTTTHNKRGRKPNKQAKVTSYLGKFNKSSVGDRVVLALKGLYFEADLEGMDESAKQIVRTASIDATIVQKDIDSLVLGVTTMGLYVLLTPWQYRMFVNVASPAEHHLSAGVLNDLLNSPSEEHRNKYALVVKLIQETTNCIFLADYTPEGVDHTAAAGPVETTSSSLDGGNLKPSALRDIAAYGSENEESDVSQSGSGAVKMAACEYTLNYVLVNPPPPPSTSHHPVVDQEEGEEMESVGSLEQQFETENEDKKRNQITYSHPPIVVLRKRGGLERDGVVSEEQQHEQKKHRGCSKAADFM